MARAAVWTCETHLEEPLKRIQRLGWEIRRYEWAASSKQAGGGEYQGLITCRDEQTTGKAKGHRIPSAIEQYSSPQVGPVAMVIASRQQELEVYNNSLPAQRRWAWVKTYAQTTPKQPQKQSGQMPATTEEKPRQRRGETDDEGRKQNRHWIDASAAELDEREKHNELYRKLSRSVGRQGQIPGLDAPFDALP